MAVRWKPRSSGGSRSGGLSDVPRRDKPASFKAYRFQLVAHPDDPVHNTCVTTQKHAKVYAGTPVTPLYTARPLTSTSSSPLQGEGRGFESLSAHEDLRVRSARSEPCGGLSLGLIKRTYVPAVRFASKRSPCETPPDEQQLSQGAGPVAEGGVALSCRGDDASRHARGVGDRHGIELPTADPTELYRYDSLEGSCVCSGSCSRR